MSEHGEMNCRAYGCILQISKASNPQQSVHYINLKVGLQNPSVKFTLDFVTVPTKFYSKSQHATLINYSRVRCKHQRYAVKFKIQILKTQKYYLKVPTLNILINCSNMFTLMFINCSNI